MQMAEQKTIVSQERCTTVLIRNEKSHVASLLFLFFFFFTQEKAKSKPYTANVTQLQQQK